METQEQEKECHKGDEAENEWDAAKTYVNEAKARLEMTPIAFMNDDLTLQLSKIERRQNDAPGDDSHIR